MEKYQAITACVFLHRDGKLFIAKRADVKKFLPGKYELIGGHIEFGETIEDGLKREISEELGIEAIVKNPFHVFTYISENENKHSVEIDYFAKMADPTQKIKLNSEDHSDYRWISEDEIDKYFQDGDAEKIAVRKGFKLLT
ncbi:MAG: NUDIX hydrolase [Parcubacteria group bacterium]|jgi:8-oxo-dGTP diphosphatase